MKTFTCGVVAKMCNVAPRTVAKWFDSGRLRGYRIPGSQDRRIPENRLVEFIREYGMPMPDDVGFVVRDGAGFVAASSAVMELIVDPSSVIAAKQAYRFSDLDSANAAVALRKRNGFGGEVLRITDVINQCSAEPVVV